MDITQYINSDPKVMLGKPVIKGTRITVELILTKLSEGFTTDDLIALYPTIKIDDVKACIAYAAQVIQSEKIIKAA